MKCIIHKLVDGFGGMGDGYLCAKCGLASYHRPANSFLTKNDGTFGRHKPAPPFVVKFPSPITWQTDWDTYTHYFNSDGVLVERTAP
jgi:hypothetical protein